MVRLGIRRHEPSNNQSILAKEKNVNPQQNDGYVLIEKGEPKLSFNDDHYSANETTNMNNSTNHMLESDHRLSYNLEADSSNFSSEVFSLTSKFSLSNEKGLETEPNEKTASLREDSYSSPYFLKHTKIEPNHLAHISTGNHDVKINDPNNNRTVSRTIQDTGVVVKDGPSYSKYSLSSQEEFIESSIVIEEITIIEQQEEILEEENAEEIIDVSNTEVVSDSGTFENINIKNNENATSEEPSKSIDQKYLIETNANKNLSSGMSKVNESGIPSIQIAEHVSLEQVENLENESRLKEVESDDVIKFSLVKEDPQIEFDSIEIEDREMMANQLKQSTPKKGPIVVDLKIETNVDYRSSKQRLNSSTTLSDDVFLASEIDSPSVKTPTYGNKKHYVFISPEIHEASTSSISDSETRTSLSLLEEIKEIESNLLVDLNAEDIVAKEEKLETSLREKELIRRMELSNVNSSPPKKSESMKSVDLVPITPKSKKKKRNLFFCGLVNNDEPN